MRSRIGFAQTVVSVLVAFVVVPVVDSSFNPAAAAPPPAPSLLAPANGATVAIPLTISWSQVADAGGYNWEISLTSSFATVLERNLTLLSGAATTQDIVSGVPNGTYFWRVQAVSRDLEAGAWSSPRSFTVNGSGPGVPGTAVLNPPLEATQFHSWENFTLTWSAVPGAMSYILQESIDPTFPVGTRSRQVNIPGPRETVSFNPGSQGTFKARVIAVNASGLMGQPSNLVDFSVQDSNPFPAAPTLSAPANGTSAQLPLTLSWTHVPNHQDLGYTLQISKNSGFTQIEASIGLSENSKIVSALSTGTKFWRVRSQHGYIGSNPAYTAWSATRSFTVLSTPLRMGAVIFPTTKFSGGEARGAVELTGAAPSGGATVTFSTNQPGLLPELPASRVVVAGETSANVLVTDTGFPNGLRGMRVGFVTTPTTVTITATYNGTSASMTMTLLPPKLNDTPFQLFPVKATGGAHMDGIVDLEVGCFAGFCDGLAPPGGFPVNLSSSSPAATVPATITIPGGAGGTSFPIETSPVSTVTTLTISAQAGGATANWQLVLTPAPPPDSLVLDPIETADGSRGVVRIPLSSMTGHDQLLRLSSSNPAVASVPQFMTIPASTEGGVFFIETSTVTSRTVVTISVTGGGVTRAVDLVVHPSLPSLTGFSVNPTSVPAGTPSTGRVTLGSPAPQGGIGVSLSSSLPGSVSVPPSVTVPAGATSATFTANTFPGSGPTTAQLTATLGQTTLFAPLGVTQPAPPAAPTLQSPSNQASGVSQPVSFNWTDVTGATSYEIQIDNNSNMTAPFVTTQIVTASQASIGSLPTQQLWWRVRARNAAGTFGSFSSTRRFTPAAAFAPTDIGGEATTTAALPKATMRRARRAKGT